MDKEKSLWGDITYYEMPTPKGHLEEQARILDEKTNNTLRGEVTKDVSPMGVFRLEFRIVAGKLNDYSRKILGVKHEIEPYPLELYDEENGKAYTCEDEKTFLAALKEILSSPCVHKVISSLISQSNP